MSDASDDPKKAENPARRKPKRVNVKALSRADEPKQPAKPEANPKGSPQQMVVKMAVPGPVLLQWVGK